MNVRVADKFETVYVMFSFFDFSGTLTSKSWTTFQRNVFILQTRTGKQYSFTLLVGSRELP